MKLQILFVLMLIGSVTYAQNPMFDICPLKVGSEIPDGTLTTIEGTEKSLHDLVDEKPTILIFYRGAWCPYCTRHLAELNDIKGDVEALGYQIFGITIDQSSKLEVSASKSGGEIEVFSDSKAELIKAYGLDWKVDDALVSKYLNDYKLDLEEWSGEEHHVLPVPAVFVIKDGLIQYQYVNPNYNTRLNPDVLLAMLKSDG